MSINLHKYCKKESIKFQVSSMYYFHSKRVIFVYNLNGVFDYLG